ncbi:choice-of-anchor J domain-containing protein [Flavobacterium sp. DGU11]|uniref:Choice-of-anchor J domain-containing protein n=1 Tax=Flavobacterium arundinis TaxID=3139143 RepID=A0ABU9HXN7_9FLAO
MRKITLVVMLVLFCNFVHSQVWTENFESGIPNTWGKFTLLNGAQGTVPAWANSTATTCQGTTGATVPTAAIGIGNTSQAWLVSPLIPIPANASLKFQAKQTYPAQNGSIYELRVSTTSATDVSTFVLLQTWTENTMNPGNQLSCYEQTITLPATYSNQSVYIAFIKKDTQYGAAAQGEIFTLDNIRLFENCYPATSASTNAIGTNSASAVVVGTTSGVWEVAVIEGTGAANSGVVTHSGASPVSLTGLNPSTAYTCYIRSNCGSSQSTWIGPYNFSTLQAATGLPFNDNFESGTVGWTLVNGTQLNKWFVGNAASAGGQRSLYISNDEGVSNAYTLTQNSTVHAYREIIIPAGTQQVGISFNWRGTGDVNDYFSVWAVPATFSPVAGTAITAAANRIKIGDKFNNSSQYQSYGYMLNTSQFAGQNMRLVFEWRNNAAGGVQPPASVDNVNVQLLTCLVPTAITFGAITQTTATVSWTQSGSATGWEVLVLPTGSPWPESNATGVISATTASQGLINLNPTSGYDVYVRAVCSASDKSLWGKATAPLLTLCGTIPTPFTETFNSNSVSDACWTVNDANADNLTWNRNATFGMYEGDQLATITKYWNSTSNNDWLISPTINLAPNQRLKFRYRVVSASYVTDLKVLLSTTGPAIANFTNVLMPQQTISNTQYDQKIIYLDAFSGPVNIAFQVPNVSTNSWTLYIDEVIIEDIPECPAPIALTASNFDNNSATLSWTPGYQETQWQVAVQPANSGMPAGNGVLVSVPSYTPSTLDTATLYEYYVRAYCSATDQSEWVGPFTFNTLVCEAADRCNYSFMVKATTGNGNYSALNVYQNNILVGTVPIASPTSTATIAICPNIPFSLYWASANWTPLTAEVLVLDSYDETVYHYIKGVTPDILPITVPVYSGIGNCTPLDCPKPQNVVLTSATSTSLTIDWTEPADAVSWEIFAVPTSTNEVAPDANSEGIIVSYHPYTIPDLVPGTRYSIYVRSKCGDADSSNWTLKDIFNTLITNDNCDTAYVLPVSPLGYCETPYHATLQGATASPQGNVCGVAANANDDVWFEFTATAASHILYINNRQGSGTSLNLSKVVYSGACNNLQQVSCTIGNNILYNTFLFLQGTNNNNDVLLNNLTVGTTYKIRVFSNYATANDTRFDICIGTPAPPLVIDEVTYTPEQLITDVLIDENCAEVSNINYFTGTNYGAPHNGIAHFARNGSDFPFERGIVLSTGKATNAAGYKTASQSASYSQTVSPYNILWLGDQQLYDYIIQTGTSPGLNNFYNATSIEFDFKAYGTEMSFDFLFASEDYGLFQCQWGDAFAFFMTDSNGQTVNLAVIPETTTPVSVTTIRDAAYNYDLNNSCPSANPDKFDKLYDGYRGHSRYACSSNFLGNTLPMTARSAVIPGETYHIKMVIAEKNDGNFDSAIFLDADSFNVGRIDLGADMLVSTNTAVCAGTDKVLDTGLSPTYFNFVWKQDGDVIPGATASAYTVTEPGIYEVIATVITSGCSTQDTIEIEFYDDIRDIVNAPEALTLCSATSEAIFNLDNNTDTILENVAIAADLTVRYFESSALAEVGDDNDAITGTSSYTAVNAHTVHVRVDNTVTGCFTLFEFNTIVVPNALALTQFSYATAICALSGQNPGPVKPLGFTEGGTYSVTASGIVIDPATGIIDLSQTTPGSYTVTYTVPNAECLTGSHFDAVVVIAQPAAPSISFSYPESCSLATSAIPVLAVGFNGGGTFTSPVLTVDPSTGVVAIEGVSPGNYEITYTVPADIANCISAGSATAQITITAPALPEASFSYANVCALEGSSVPVLPSGFTAGGSFSSSTLTVDPATGIIDLSGVSPGIYEVAYTVAQNVSSCIAAGSYTAQITIEPATTPQISFSYADACILDTNASPMLNAGFVQGGTFSSSTLTINPSSGMIDLSNATAGLHEVVYTVAANTTTCELADSYTAEINIGAAAQPVATFTYADACSLDPDATPIAPAGFTLGGTYSSATLTVDATTGVINISTATAGPHQVTYTLAADPALCRAAASHTASITINAAASPQLVFSYANTCILDADAEPVFSGGFTSGGSYSSATLAVDATTGVIDISTATAGVHQVTYTLAADPALCRAAASHTASITINAAASPQLAFSYANTCMLDADAEPVLSGGFTPGGSYSSTTLTVDASTGIIDLQGVSAGTYEIVYTVGENTAGCISGGSYTATITILAATSPVIAFSYADQCQLETNAAPILPTGFAQGGVFSSAALAVNSTSGIVNLSNVAAGTYQVTYTVPSNTALCIEGGTHTANITVVAPSAPNMGFTYDNVCQGSVEALPELSNDFTFGGTFTSATLSVDPETGVIDLGGATAGDHQVTYTMAPDAELCISGGTLTATIAIAPQTVPNTSFTYEEAYCMGAGTVQPLLAPGFAGGGTFTANVPGLALNTADGSIDISGSQEGSYTITYNYTSQDECEQDGSSSFTITLANNISAVVEGDCNAGEFYLEAMPANGSYDSSSADYEWRDAQGTVLGNDAGFNASDYLRSNPGISLPVVFTVTVDTGDCAATASYTLNSVLCDVQRGISPNGDGENDSLDLTGMGVTRLIIFNRYGKKVYEQRNYTNEWAGQTDSGETLSTGTYFYSIELQSAETKTGWIYVNRED